MRVHLDIRPEETRGLKMEMGARNDDHGCRDQGGVVERERYWRGGSNARGHVERSLVRAGNLAKRQEGRVKEPGGQTES